MLWGAFRCSVAWGLVDAVFYIMGCLSERGHNLKLLKQVRTTEDPQDAKEIIAGGDAPAYRRKYAGGRVRVAASEGERDA